MNGYEKIIKMMKCQTSSSRNVFLTTMENESSCYVNELLLESDDLLKADHLTDLKKGDAVIVIKVNEETYAVLERVV